MKFSGEQIKWEKDYGYTSRVLTQHLMANIKGLVQEELIKDSKKGKPQE